MTTGRKIYSSVYPVIILMSSLYFGGIFAAPVVVCGILALVMVWVFRTDLASLWRPLLIMWGIAIVTVILLLASSELWGLIAFLALAASLAVCIIFCQSIREGIALMAIDPCLHLLLILPILLWYAENIGFDEKLPMT